MRTVAPFAENTGHIAVRLEDFSNRHFFGSHRLPAARDTVHAGAQMMAAGQQARARWGAHRTDEESVKTCSPGRDAVHIGGLKNLIAVQGDIASALVIGEDKKDVWS